MSISHLSEQCFVEYILCSYKHRQLSLILCIYTLSTAASVQKHSRMQCDFRLIHCMHACMCQHDTVDYCMDDVVAYQGTFAGEIKLEKEVWIYLAQ